MFSAWMPPAWRKREKPRFRPVRAAELKVGDEIMCRRGGDRVFRILTLIDHRDWVEVTTRRSGRCHVGVMVDGFSYTDTVWRKCK